MCAISFIVSYFEIHIICFYNSTTTMCAFGFVGPQTGAIFIPIATRRNSVVYTRPVLPFVTVHLAHPNAAGLLCWTNRGLLWLGYISHEQYFLFYNQFLVKRLLLPKGVYQLCFPQHLLLLQSLMFEWQTLLQIDVEAW